MSTGANCYFEEREPRKWYYIIQLYPYGETEDYDTGGPFVSFSQAKSAMDRRHANPGGYSIESHPDSDDKSWEEG